MGDFHSTHAAIIFQSKQQGDSADPKLTNVKKGMACFFLLVGGGGGLLF